MELSLLIPEWPAPASVRAVCSTRTGGRSLPPYDSLNLGNHVGDEAGAVAANRAAFAGAINVRPVFLRQVHGRNTVELSADTPDDTQADGCATGRSRIACTIMAADCLPVLLCDTHGTVVAAAHAGWRGLAGDDGEGILEATLMHFRRLARSQSGLSAIETIAWLGPCIGPDSFEVGSEVKAAFEAHDRRAGTLFTQQAGGKWLADLPGLARRRLQALGVTQIYGNDGGRDWCTVSNPSKFFSHRRDRVSGRFAASVWLS